MNEAYQATGVLEKEDQANAADGFGSETTGNNWDQELTDLVAANAHDLVKPSWMDVELPLGAAINTYSVVLTPETMPLYISVVLELLANRVTETEEPTEEDKPEKESAVLEEESSKLEEVDQGSNAEIKAQKAPENSNTVDEQRQPKTEIELSGDLEPSIDEAAKAEAAGSSSNSSAATNSQDSIGAPVELADTNSKSGSAAPESTMNEAGQEFKAGAPSIQDQLKVTKAVIKAEVEASGQIPTFEIPLAEVAAKPVSEETPLLDNPQLAAGQNSELGSLPAATKAAAEPEPAEVSPLDFERLAIPDEITELRDEKIEVAEDEALPQDHYEEAGLEPGGLYVFSDIPALEVIEDRLEIGEEASVFELRSESNLSEQMDITSPEQYAQISLTIEEIEKSLIQLAESISASEPETTKKVNDVLDKIIEVPARLEAQTGEDIITEAEAQEELEELFTELLEAAGLNYSPELIESLARLTLKWRLASEREGLKNEEEPDEIPQDGTHEIIKKLPLGLSNIKRAMAQAPVIGRSALQLSNINLAA